MEATYIPHSKMFRITATRHDMEWALGWAQDKQDETQKVLDGAVGTDVADYLGFTLKYWAKIAESFRQAIVEHDNPPKRVRKKPSAPRPFGQWSKEEVRAYLGREPNPHEVCAADWAAHTAFTRNNNIDKREEFEKSMRGEQPPELV